MGFFQPSPPASGGGLTQDQADALYDPLGAAAERLTQDQADALYDPLGSSPFDDVGQTEWETSLSQDGAVALDADNSYFKGVAVGSVASGIFVITGTLRVTTTAGSNTPGENINVGIVGIGDSLPDPGEGFLWNVGSPAGMWAGQIGGAPAMGVMRGQGSNTLFDMAGAAVTTEVLSSDQVEATVTVVVLREVA